MAVVASLALCRDGEGVGSMAVQRFLRLLVRPYVGLVTAAPVGSLAGVGFPALSEGCQLFRRLHSQLRLPEKDDKV